MMMVKCFYSLGQYLRPYSVALILCVILPDLVMANTAEVVLVIGKGEKRIAEQLPWEPVAATHKVPAGGFVRTLANSQLGLLLPDRTQIRLNQNSLMQIKSVSDAAKFRETSVRLNSGRAWSQARPSKGPAAAGALNLSMETPSATLSIRGTDWEVEVLPDGSTQLVVLSGAIDLGNAAGSLRVERGEQAVAVAGKMPVKTRLTNPKSRVQWVSSWRVQPHRWGVAGRDAAVRVAADEKVQSGDVVAAVALLEEHATSQAAEPLTTALYVRILALGDRLSEARTLVGRALERYPDHLELHLAAGDLAILDGDVGGARTAFMAALEDDAKNGEGWYGLGRIASERGDVQRARNFLDRAIGLNSRLQDARAERATVDTMAGDFGPAGEMLDRILIDDPENLVAQTALGLNHLRRGQTEQALEAFLKAGTIEPKYARAWLYSAAAFYRLGDRARALQALDQAAELDPKDPLPHLLRSLILGDDLDYGRAIVSARDAQERLPNLKSLDQVVNDQKGSANLGSALANFGLEQWSAAYAATSATPFWAGSHLFQADRQTGEFNKNSALYMGYLTDPTVFGASDRNSSLLPTPGQYAKIEGQLEHGDWDQVNLVGTLNGLRVEPIPIAYFFNGDVGVARSRTDESTGEGSRYVVGLGVRPRFDLGLFTFITGADLDADLRTPALVNDRMTLREQRADLGMNHKFAPDRQLWLKMGGGTQQSKVEGAFFDAGIASKLNQTFWFANTIQPLGDLRVYRADKDQIDLQLRYAAAFDGGVFSAGLESAHETRSGDLDVVFDPVRLYFQQETEAQSFDGHIAAKFDVSKNWSIHGGLWHQTGKMHRHERSLIDFVSVPDAGIPMEDQISKQSYAETNPGFGFAWRQGQAAVLRLVTQHWRRPASSGSLGQMDVLGMPVNDRLVMTGGRYQRARLQYDVTYTDRSFIQVFVDRERVNNGLNGISTVVPALELSQLDALRNRRQVFSPQADLEATPEFERGRVSSFGVAGNALITLHHSLSLQYLYRDGRQEGARDGLAIPFVPRHMLRMGSQWSLPGKLLMGLSATYRSHRYEDDDNGDLLESGWNAGATLYWESADRRDAIQIILDNIVSKAHVSTDKKPLLSFRYTHKF